ncbi:MAG TPA: tetratricopeptide repeat protein [Tepidisphaeraceae bacterium]|nr:tetratricopeptide repeat protein [Tepidisphaeraceae bacterium]
MSRSSINPTSLPQLLKKIDEQYRAGDLAQAETICREALAQFPDATIQGYLGAILMQTGRIDQAIDAFSEVVRANPDNASSLNNLAAALHHAKRYDEAIAAGRSAIALRPDYAEAYNNLGLSLHEVSQFADAAECFKRAVELQPANAAFFANFAMTLAILGRPEESARFAQQAITYNPHAAGAYNMLANALGELARLDEAFAAYRQAIQLAPDWPVPHSNLCYGLYFHPKSDLKSIQQFHAEWYQLRAAQFKNAIEPHANDPSPARQLKIGYVSPYFSDHCQSFFTIPLFTARDKEQFKVYCYSDVIKPDALTSRLQGLVDVWQDSSRWPDEQLARQIKTDQIDILVDLTMHMGGGRPLLFARKPAPIQVAWLAYPGTTGLATMDYRITDPRLDPPGTNDEFYCEQSVRLSHTFWCYDPLTSELAVNDLPADANGYITFGSLNNYRKVSDAVLNIWSEIFGRLPTSRLLMLAPAGNCRTRVINALGIETSRITFLDHQSRKEYLACYHRIDIGLDTFPYNGHTTTLDAAWMGVPVVTFAGRTPVGRGGLSINTNLGLQELVAGDKRQMIDTAVQLARDVPKLKLIRAKLRQTMQASPLMDATAFARNMESFYRSAWQRWCHG